jgi:CBS domain-containing protein
MNEEPQDRRRVGDVCVRRLTVATPETSLRSVSALMDAEDKGWVILVEQRGLAPVGVVTASSIVKQLARFGRHTVKAPASAAAEPLMALTTEHAGLADVSRLMSGYRLPCVPVVDPRGALCGVVTKAPR